MAMIERDLRGIWTYDVKKNAVLIGRNRDVASFEADRVDMLTTTDSMGYVLDAQNKPHHTHLCEVGYWLKPNPRYRDLMELWRREDPLVDQDILTDGRFQLVHDRIKSFKLTYYRSLGHEAEELNEWDSTLDGTLPRRTQGRQIRMRVGFRQPRLQFRPPLYQMIQILPINGREVHGHVFLKRMPAECHELRVSVQVTSTKVQAIGHCA